MSCCDDSLLLTDYTFYDWFRPMMVYNNATLFVLGSEEIHYANIKLFEEVSGWKHMQLPYIGGFWRNGSYVQQIKSQRYTQYDSSLYIFVESDVYSLININLHSLEGESYQLPASLFDSYYGSCMVSDAFHVYIVRVSDILIYDVNAGNWTISINFGIENSEGLISTKSACTITNDGNHIYIFGYLYYDNVLKYDILNDQITYLDSPNLCYTALGRGITAPNNKMYLHGCYVASWKTIIFNPDIEQFEAVTIDIDIPTDIPYYKEAQLTVFDDNVLLLYYMFDGQAGLYYTITDLISINLIDTISKVWPSDGFTIRYRVNDFANMTTEVYHIWFICTETVDDINRSITLNTSNDNCICNETSYKCFNCVQYLNLSKHLSIMDNDVDELHFAAISDSNWLILPKYITIELERCNVLFNDINKVITSNNPTITFSFSLSSNCYSRAGSEWSLDITAFKVNISKELIISIIDNDTTLCKICNGGIDGDNCIYYEGNNFIIDHEVTNLHNAETFDMFIESNMIDLKVIASNHTIQYFTNSGPTKFNNDLLYLLIIPIIIIIIVIVYCRKQYMNAFIVDKALVLIIGCSQFDDKKKYLPGVKRNVDDLTNLWRKYNYHVLRCNIDTLYCTKRDIIKFVENKLKLFDNSYKCVIVHVISHGSSNSFTSSDLKEIKLDFIRHELIEAAEEADNLGLIKIIFHHACRGTVDYHIGNNEIRHQQQRRVTLNIRIRGSTNHTSSDDISYDSNCITIYGNISGRSMSDNGYFTQCICDAFGKNVEKLIKATFNELMVDIGRSLERITNHAELCTVKATVRFDSIRFVKYKGIIAKCGDQIELQRMQNTTQNNDQYEIESKESDKNDYESEVMMTENVALMEDHKDIVSSSKSKGLNNMAVLEEEFEDINA